MPSMTASAPTKIPGITPVSGKDPKKMAEQLKNPRPKKPKMEVMKTDKNGQWSLEKRQWSDKDAKWVYHKELDDANRKVEHTNTGQRGIKAYTTSVHGTAEEQANSGHYPILPVKHIPVSQHIAERKVKN